MGIVLWRLANHNFWVLSIFYLCLLVTTGKANGQIVPDATLPNNTVVTSNGNTSTILGGTRVGNNLFHSFQQFSLPTGTAAFFNNALDTQNIFSRVTGGNISHIDGLIQANGKASLFFINPSGIIFGPHAQLKIGGSFIGSTANSIEFTDGSFSATNPQAPPLLKINVPIGLQFGSNPTSIVNQSQANNVGLQVLPGQTLGLVGGDLLLSGGLKAAQGQIELGSLASPGFVSLTPTATGLVLGYQNMQKFGSIQLTDAAAVNVSGLGGGKIQVQGGQVTLSGGARLVAETFGNLAGGGIEIQATQFTLQPGSFVSTSTFGSGAGGNLTVHADTVELTGTTPLKTERQLLAGTFNPLKLSNGLFSLSGGSGAAGNITIDTGMLGVQNGANVMTTAFGRGAGGNITLKAGLAELTNGSLIFTGASSSGSSGNLAITAQQLRVLDGTSLSTTPGATSTGRGGNLSATADSIELRGTPAGATVPDGLFTTTLGAGDAGDLTVFANQLVVADGAQVSAAATGRGRGGNLTVTADTVELSGPSADGRFLGGFFTSAALLAVPGQQGGAPAGNLTVNTRQLSVRNGARISTATGSGGAAGSLTVNASDSVEVSGFATGIAPSMQSTSLGATNNGITRSGIEANTFGTGKAGDLSIYTGQLTVQDGGEIGVGSTGSGSVGNIHVTTNSLLLSQGMIAASSVLGQGGNIKLQVRDASILRHGSEISTRAGTANTGGGNGGNITIDTGVLAVLESSINANAFSGAGGNIRITTEGIFVFPDSAVTASSTLGVNGIIEINQLNVDPSRGLVKLPENVPDASHQITAGCTADQGNHFVVTGRGGLPPSPEETLNATPGWVDWRVSGSGKGEMRRGGSGEMGGERSKEVLSQRSPTPDSLAEATGWVMRPDGTVQLVADPLAVAANSYAQNCQTSHAGSN